MGGNAVPVISCKSLVKVLFLILILLLDLLDFPHFIPSLNTKLNTATAIKRNGVRYNHSYLFKKKYINQEYIYIISR